jgi:acetyl-CoA acetyltransferase
MLLGTALDELERRGEQTALVTMCIGGQIFLVDNLQERPHGLL